MVQWIKSFLGLIRFSHTLFALPFALTSATLAWKRQGEFHWLQLMGILLCMVFARSAAMAFNRITDRHWDAENPRTKNRHIPAGILSVTSVVLFTIVCSNLFVVSTLIFLRFDNPWPFYLAIPVLLFIGAYSYTKRFTALAHWWLGASLMLTPLAAWIAIRGLSTVEDLQVPLLLGGAVLFWVAGFDILYACQDVDFDRQAKLHSIPALLGVPGSLRLAAVSHLIMVMFLFVLAWVGMPELGTIYLIGIILVALLLVIEHWLVRPDDLSRVNLAFFQVNGVISLGLFAIVLLQIAVGT